MNENSGMDVVTDSAGNCVCSVGLGCVVSLGSFLFI